MVEQATSAEERLAVVTGVLSSLSSRRDWEGRAIFYAYLVAIDAPADQVQHAWEMLEDVGAGRARNVQGFIDRARSLVEAE